MRYIHALPGSTSFTGKGLLGYTFGPLNQKDIEIYYVDVETGHDTFLVSKKITRIYYILCGTGYFIIDDQKYDVSEAMLVEIPPGVEYSYSGKMKLIALSKPRWFAGNDKFTKWNPDVVRGDFAPAAPRRSWLAVLLGLRIFGRSPIGAYLQLNQRLWDKFPAVTTLRPIRAYGNFLHRMARLQSSRAQAFSTFFLRNRHQLELIRRLAERSVKADTFRIAVLGCSTGAEVYSIAWTIRSARSGLKVVLQAVDISKQAVEVGERGKYSLAAAQLTNTNIVERMTDAEVAEFFDKDSDVLTVKSWIREGIEWQVADVGEPQILVALGRQDVVVANNFLCHMDDAMAEACLRNIARLVKPDGYLIVSGIDVDIRAKVAADSAWRPVQELLEEIHEGDLRAFWPCHYAGLEPLNKRRPDWRLRYASAFQLVAIGQEYQNLGEVSAEDNSVCAPMESEFSATCFQNKSAHVSEALSVGSLWLKGVVDLFRARS